MGKHTAAACVSVAGLPSWLPGAARNYLLHTESGLSIRALARNDGCHASTVLRQVRRLENRRDDQLIDEILHRLGAAYFRVSRSGHSGPEPPSKGLAIMTVQISKTAQAIHSGQSGAQAGSARAGLSRQDQEERRAMLRLSETGAVLAVSKDLDKAVVVRTLPGGKSARTAVVDREVAQTLALKDWISCSATGKVSQYQITATGRAALKRMLSRQDPGQPGFHDVQARFGDQHGIWGEKQLASGCSAEKPRHIRYNLAESPLAGLARRKDKDGRRFLSDDLVRAGEQLREDFELAQMGPRVAQNWERFLTGGRSGTYQAGSGGGTGPEPARRRVSAALEHLGPGLGDVVLRCCCFLEGMEAAEKRMGWSARSGKIVLRIALQRLKCHYDDTQGKYGPMIG